MREQFSESIQEYNELLHAQEHAKRPFDQQAIQEELQRVEVYYASHEDVAPEDERAVLLLQ